jgi:hypothetical protein
MGASPDDFTFVVEDVLEEYREAQPEFADMQAPIDKKGAYFFLNQNSREPVTEPEEMVPLWKILHLVGADWTYGSKGWGKKILSTCNPTAPTTIVVAGVAAFCSPGIKRPD